MTLTPRSLLVTLAAVCAASSALAQAPYKEIKGTMEFTGRMIVRPYTPTELQARGFAPEAARTKALAAWQKVERTAIRQDPEVGEVIVLVPAGSSENSYSQELMKTGLYAYASPDWMIYPAVKPNDTDYSKQWHHQTMQSEGGWDIFTGSINTRIAICDTGVELAHPDLQSLLVPGYNAPDDKRQADGGAVEDINGHGTHVAGCAAAKGNNGLGVAGVTWNSRIMPIRVSNFASGGAFTSDSNRGVRWAADNGAKVINLSYAGIPDPSKETTGAYVRSKNALFVHAAGNDAANLDFDWMNVLIVGASEPGDLKAGFSAYGKAIDVFAPGVNILSSVMGKGYGFASGTSMASPVASGLAGLIWSYAPNLNSFQVEQVLSTTCDKIGSEATFGFGRINVRKALLRTRELLTAKTDLALSSSTLTLGTVHSGAPSALGLQDRGYYQVVSATQPRVGEAAALQATFKFANPSKVTSYEVIAVGHTSITQATTGSLFLLNRQTGKHDLVASQPLTGFDGTLKFSVSSATLSRYTSASGEVVATARAYAANTRSSGQAAKFVFRLDQFIIRADVRN